MAARIRAVFGEVMTERGVPPGAARLQSIEVVRIWREGDETGATAHVQFRAPRADPSGRAGRRARGHRELWRVSLDGRVTDIAPADAGAVDLNAPPLPEAHPSG